VGANALGLVNRGFDTYVAPSMGNSLQQTYCESCGMCISTCPTGALTENVPFKPGPVKLEKVHTICNYCSIGCEIELGHNGHFFMEAEGSMGGDKPGNLCKYGKFGYRYLNGPGRITKPMRRLNGKFEEIGLEEALAAIAGKIKEAGSGENAFFAGARMSNEELYLLQKLARAGAATNNVGSFHYLGREKACENNVTANVPFEQLKEAGKIYLFGAELSRDNGVLGFMVNEARVKNKVPVELLSCSGNSPMEHKVDTVRRIGSYYHFIRAVNHWLLENKLQNQLFIDDNCDGFAGYRDALLAESFESLVKAAGAGDEKVIGAFAEEYNRQLNAILIFSEKEVCANTCIELFNLAMITGKLGKTASGLISVKEKNNAQGIFDMGITPLTGPGGHRTGDKEFVDAAKKAWNADAIPAEVNPDLEGLLTNGAIGNLFIFGEDPLGCTTDREKVLSWLKKAGFVVVSDYFMTDTAREADLILPAGYPLETGGTFTNTQKVIRQFERAFDPKAGMNTLEQLASLMQQLGLQQSSDPDMIMQEIAGLLPASETNGKYMFTGTGEPGRKSMFAHGCDHLVKRFDEEFERAFGTE
jgi:formate dehydrogenase major subunit